MPISSFLPPQWKLEISLKMTRVGISEIISILGLVSIWLFVHFFQVQTLYYSAEHKLLDGHVLDKHNDLFAGEEDGIHLVQV